MPRFESVDMVALSSSFPLESHASLDRGRVRPIAKLGDPVLRQACAPVTDSMEVGSVIDDLHVTLDYVKSLYRFERGCGLAAPQIGESLRIAVVEFEGDRHVLINPELQYVSPEVTSVREGCLSFFDARGDVSRHRSITVVSLDELGRSYMLHAEEEFAALVQHEMDHLDGILYFDRISEGKRGLRYPGQLPRIP